MKMLVMSMF